MKRAFFLVAALAVAGCETPPPRDYVPSVANFFLESGDPRAATVTLPKSGVKLNISPAPAILAGDITDVALAQVELGRCLMFQLTPPAARDLYRLSAANQGHRLVLLINGAAFGARPIDAPIADGRLFIFVEVPDDALSALVANLKRTAADLQRALAKKK